MCYILRDMHVKQIHCEIYLVLDFCLQHKISK